MSSTNHSPDTFMPIIGIKAGDVPRRMLVVGDPKRARRVAEMLENAVELAHNREYLTIAGTFNGQHVGVISHGVGSAGATVCFEELCRSGADYIIRAGTAGGMQPHVLDGALVIATAAVRDEGTSSRLVPLSFPACASIGIVLALRDASTSLSADSDRLIEEGVVLSSDLFYPHDVLGGDLLQWQRAGVLAVEMEVSSLFITAALHGVDAGAILAIDGNPLSGEDSDMSDWDPHRQTVADTVDAAIVIGLTALTADQ